MDWILIIALISLAISIGSLVWIFLLHTHYQNLTRGVSQKDLLSSLNHFIKNTQENSSSIEDLTKQLTALEQTSQSFYQHIGFLRYNPFTDTGGDQSFSLSLLNHHGDGIIITSLHSRENTRVYAKTIKAWESVGQVLSKEEQQIIKKP